MYILQRVKTQFIGVNLRVQVKKVYLNEFGASEASFVMKFLGEKQNLKQFLDKLAENSQIWSKILLKHL